MKADFALLPVVLVAVAMVVVHCIPLWVTPYQIDYGEGLILDGAISLQQHQPLYPDPQGLPVVIHVYGPLAYAVPAAAMVGKAPSFPAGRFVILGCCVLLSVLLALILRRQTGSLSLGIAFGFLLWTLPGFRFWTYLLRADAIAAAFTFVGIAIYLRDNRKWYWSVPWFGLAVFSKYSLVAAPVAVFLHLLLNRRTRESVWFGGAFGLVCLVPFAILQYTTSGWFSFHMFSTHPDPYSLLQFLGLTSLIWVSAPVVTALAAWHVAGSLLGRAPSFPAIYFAVSAFTGLTAGKLGSTTNHFVEWMLASCLCAGLGYSTLAKRDSRWLPRARFALCFSVLLCVIVQNRITQDPTRGLADCEMVYRQVRESPAPAVFAESLGPVLLARKTVLVSDPFVYDQLVQVGKWPDRRIETLLADRQLRLLIMAQDPAHSDLPEPLLHPIQGNYQVTGRYVCRDAAVILEPLSVPPAPPTGPVSPK